MGMDRERKYQLEKGSYEDKFVREEALLTSCAVDVRGFHDENNWNFCTAHHVDDDEDEDDDDSEEADHIGIVDYHIYI